MIVNIHIFGFNFIGIWWAGRYFGRAEYISHFGQAKTLVYTLCDIVKSLLLFFGSKQKDISINCQSRVGGRDSNKSK